MGNQKKSIFFSEELLSQLTYSAYQVALKAGINKPFLEVELEIWKCFQKIFKDARKINKLDYCEK